MSGLFGRKTNPVSSTAPTISSVRITTAVAGKPIPLIYGRTRVAPNVIQTVNFQQIAHSSSSSSGSKGGSQSSGNSNTTYTYQCDITFGVCEGPIDLITSVWSGKTRFYGTNAAVRSTLAKMVGTINANGTATSIYTENSGSYTTDLGVIVGATGLAIVGGNDNVGNWYPAQANPGTDYTVSGGVYTFSSAFCAANAGNTVTIVYLYNASNYAQSAAGQVGLGEVNGYIGQSPWAYMTANFPTVARAYSGMALAVGSAFQLDSSGGIPNLTFEVNTPWGFNAAVVDANPADILVDMLTNIQYGAYYPAHRIGDVSSWYTYCAAANLFLSPAYVDQKPMHDIITQLMLLTNSNCFFSEKRLKVVPYADIAVSGTYRNWTPNLTAVYALNDDNFLPFGGGDQTSASSAATGDGTDGPVQIARKSPADKYNFVTLNIYDRSQAYNESVIVASDQATIDKFGIRAMSPVDAYEICDVGVGRQAAQVILQRSIYVNNTYTFTLSFAFCLLEPMDLLTITDTALGLNAQLVRIISIAEDDALNLTIVAEEVPVGHASAILYATPSSTGYQPQYNALAGNVQPPQFFEAPVNQAGTTGLAVWGAVTGSTSDANWGGADVYASSDGTNYKFLQTIHAGARYGTLAAAMGTTGNATVQGVGQTQTILPGTTADANNEATLIWYGGTSPGGEFSSYVGASLIAPFEYTLSGLVRGQYNSPVTGHSSGSPWVRVDDNIIKSGPLPLNNIGTTMYFKFCSFNQFGGGEQSLGAVTAYSYTITGAQTLLPPANVASVAAVSQNFGVSITWPLDTTDIDIDYYRLRVGSTSSTWATANPLVGTSTQGTHISGDNFFWSPQLAGTYKIMVKAVTTFGVESVTEAAVNYTVAVPAPTSGSGGFAGPNYVLNWNGAEGNFLIEGFNIYTGATFSGATRIATNVQSSTFTALAQWNGVQKFYITSIDAAGNESPTALEIDLTVVPPGTPASFVTQVTDNNVLFFWTPPSIGTLPIASYKLTKGATFSTSNTIGLLSGADSFQPWSETASGTYSYWLQATDTAGNVCATPANVSVNVAAPPNFILQSDIHTNFDGALVNMYVNGPIPTPVDTNSANTGNSIGVVGNLCTNLGTATGNYLAKIKSSKETGKWYFEWHITVAASAVRVGICQANSPVTQLSADTSSWSYNQAGTITNGGTSSQTGLATFAAGDVIGVVMNCDAHTLQFYKNGTAVGTAVTIASATPWYAAISLPASGDKADGYFGERAMSYPQTGVIANGVLENGNLYGPANSTETWLQHGTNNSWTTPNAQVAAGDSLYFQPNMTTGSYEEVVDYGVTISSSLIQMTWTLGGNAIGTVAITPKISVSNTSDTGPWTDYAGVSQQFASGFRWVKYHFDFTCALGANLLEMIDIEYKLSLKQKFDAGSGNAVSTDSGGTVTNFNIAFASITAIVVTPQSSGGASIIPVVNFAGGSNPTSFQVELFNSSGTRVSGAFSWTAQGV